jgi:hypothetical protein
MKAPKEISIKKSVKASDDFDNGIGTPQIEKDESEYRELLKECIIWQWEIFEYYQNLCKAKGLSNIIQRSQLYCTVIR